MLAFPLDTNLQAVIRFEALDPPDDSFIVNGSSVATSWNRGQVLVALGSAELQGNLPPKIVAARSFEKGRRVRGKVVDRFLDAVLGAQVSLEKSIGRRLDEGLVREDEPARLLLATGEAARDVPRGGPAVRLHGHEPQIHAGAIGPR